ncbi:MAG: hypothetical protein NTX87_08840 [Planctomycetota bacterium]|nr:hypothetical protein [Planctomycetota bacterium]
MKRTHWGLVGVSVAAILAAASVFLAADGNATPAAAPAFTDITGPSGVGAVLDEKYRKEPKWWLSSLNLVDLDGDGRLDLFLGEHGGGAALALLGDGRGRFTPAQGEYPTS